MITFFSGDIFTSGCDALVNTVNCQGVMGKGLALQFKNRFPAYYKQYRKEYKNYSPGNCYYYIPDAVAEPVIVSCTTKDHWMFPSKEEWIESCCVNFCDTCKVELPLWTKTVAFPLLGAGCGGINPNLSKNIMANILDKICGLEIQIWEL